MKKRLTLIAVVLLTVLSVTACRSPEDPNGSDGTKPGDETSASESDTDDDRLLNTPVGDIDIEQTRTYKSLKLLEGDTFSLTVKAPFNMQLFRRGDDIKVVVLSLPQMIVDGRFYPIEGLDFPSQTAHYTPVTDADVQDTLDMMEDLDSLVSDALEGATLREIGIKEFRFGADIYEDMYFEEFTDADGNPLRLYFNEQREMYGAHLMMGDIVTDIINHISPNVADNVFNLIPGFESVPAAAE
jgi:hypothetical protein